MEGAAAQLETASTIRRKNNREVHFRHDHVQYRPQGYIPDEAAPLKLPVCQVCHVTHQREAQLIKLNDFSFIPREKYGKSYDRDDRPYGVSYRCTTTQIPDANTPCYQRILPTETVLPGRYSWWGLSVAPADIPNGVKWGRYRPDYLMVPPQSMYGSIAFVTTFSNLLQQYAHSRGHNLQDVCLRMGGTLRYDWEIAYVVIVCTIHDINHNEELESCSPITYASRVFDPNGLVNNKGRVIKETVVPQFTARHYKTTDVYDYGTLDFALYFDHDSNMSLICPTSTRNVNHEYCPRKQAVKSYNEVSNSFITQSWCPDRISEEEEMESDWIKFMQSVPIELY